MNRIKKNIEKVIHWGADVSSSKQQLKKNEIFNIVCFIWYLLSLLMLFEDLLVFGYLQKISLFVSALLVVVNIITQYIHYRKNYTLAYLLYIINIIVLTFVVSNYFYPQFLLEYYYIAAPLISLFFIDNKKINFAILAVAYACFFVPNLFFKHYSLVAFNGVTHSILFLGLFIIVNHFKKLNTKNEKALEVKTEELRQLNEFKSQFFVNISHEIRTPLTLIKGETDRLSSYCHSTSSEIIDIQEGLNRQVYKITKMVDDVLDLAKMDSAHFSLNLQYTNLTNLLSKIYVSFEPVFKQKNIDFVFVRSTKNYFINADAIYLERAINNIILNAFKYTEQGSVVLQLTQEKDIVKISIKDTGVGIPEEDIDKICNRFFQVNNDINKTGGNGIGLAFSNEIISLHTGKMQIKSVINEGSNFIISLPLVAVEENNTPEIPPKSVDIKLVKKTKKQTAEKKQNILLVEDNAEMRAYLKSILVDYHCFEAENGLEALDLLNKNAVDLILTDYMMPKMNGFDFIKALKESVIDLPILMLTAKADRESKLEILRLGIDDYLQKPFEKDELLVRIKNALTNFAAKTQFIEEKNISTTEMKQNSKWIKELQIYVENHCGDSGFSQVSLELNFNVSTSSLYRKIKTETGLSPKDFITEIRLQKAQEIVKENPHISLKRLALEVGYSSSFYFSKLYKKRFGCKISI